MQIITQNRATFFHKPYKCCNTHTHTLPKHLRKKVEYHAPSHRGALVRVLIFLP